MIIEYHRPESIKDALILMSRDKPVTKPLAGGSFINQPSKVAIAVVDLQDLGLNSIHRRGNSIEIGAMVTLQSLLDYVEKRLDNKDHHRLGLLKTLYQEVPYNLRQVATIAGTLVSADGRSPFATTMLALDVNMEVITRNNEVKGDNIRYGNLLPFRSDGLRGKLITKVLIPVNVRTAFAQVARSPADMPIVCVCVCLWPSGRTRVALGGFGDMPLLALDGTESEGASEAATSACQDAEDVWASAAYRQEIVGILVQRCVGVLQGIHNVL